MIHFLHLLDHLLDRNPTLYVYYLYQPSSRRHIHLSMPFVLVNSQWNLAFSLKQILMQYAKFTVLSIEQL
jgi:hypothetical protein